MGKAKKQSILASDMEHCMLCGAPYPHGHHVLFGKNKKMSDKYKLIVPLCYRHHNGSDEGVHFNKTLDTALKIMAQRKFEEVYPDLDFREIFDANYL